ncbi:MAG: hypothetical protein JWM95_2418 [Gemmatimonadetes bacterium]|nr:hypothetical protein [Gemmatimonadota bacterium]
MVAAYVLGLVRQLASDAERRAADHATRADMERRATDAAREQAAILRQICDALASEPEHAVASTWREKLWTCPAETRLTVNDVAEALGWSRSNVYHRLRPDGPLGALPHRKQDNNTLVFLAGEVRSWINQHEVIAQAGTVQSAATRHLRRRRHAAH